MSTQPTVLEQLVYLQLQEAQHHDPVRFRFIESLVKRALLERNTVRSNLLNKAKQALDAYSKAMALPKACCLRENKKATKPSPLVELVHALTDTDKDHGQSQAASFTQQLQQQEHALLNDGATDADMPTRHAQTHRTVLRASKTHQKLQAKKHLDQFIDKALKQTPDDPGPLNPEMLIIRLLKHTNELSPEYLNCYVSYFETLQALAAFKP